MNWKDITKEVPAEGSEILAKIKWPDGGPTFRIGYWIEEDNAVCEMPMIGVSHWPFSHWVYVSELEGQFKEEK